MWYFYRDSQVGNAIYWAKYCCDNILIYKTSVITFKMADYGNHKLLDISVNRWLYLPERVKVRGPLYGQFDQKWCH